MTFTRSALLTSVIAFAMAAPARAEVPTTIGFTARLTDESGLAITGPRRIELSLFDAAEAGTAAWTEVHEVTVGEGGAVHLALGAMRPIDAAVLSKGPLFLEIKVGDVVMQPRLSVASVPYAVRAAVADRIEPGGDLEVSRLLEGGLGGSRHQPALSCADLHSKRAAAPSGVYWLKPPSAPGPFEAYCDMDTDGGGWTLVWSNLRGGRGKPATEIQWGTAINSLPRISGTLSTDLESFSVYTGLKHWVPLAPGFTLRYSWANDYGSAVDQSYSCTFNLTTDKYVLSFSSSTCKHLVGTVVPGLVAGHNGKPFSTYDVQNDGRAAGACSPLYTNTPFWYGDCWSGSINGGGELSSNSYFNGAYWAGSTLAWGSDAGVGAGNGWIFVR